ncbi:hypothetical protein KFE25_010736 [Diacronema lutheri]|uniref:S1 motif domain-containing protein n=2 Tax=Diacronema lutheri TaxID=2081491 RepID=A0A8J6C8W6_DIALT|nr:hypothetical protein KFE25_010736 [Diacronema lutheri]
MATRALRAVVLVLAAAGARAAAGRAKAAPRRTLRAALPPAQYTLAERAPGEELRGVVVGQHADKVFVDVLTARPAAGGENRTRRVVACTRVPGLKRVLRARKTGRMLRGAVKPPPIGAEVGVQVTSVQAQSGRLCARLLRPVAARGLGTGGAEEEQVRELEQLSPATELRGRVVSQTPYEAFVDCGVSRAARNGSRKRINARLPLRELAQTVALRPQAVRAEGATRTLRDGDDIAVWALEVLPAAGRLTVTMQPRTAAQMATERRARVRARRKKRPAAASLALGSVRAGIVTKRLPYGCLVDVGARSPGLLHASAMPAGRATLAQLSVGDTLTVRVIKAATRADGGSADTLGLELVENDELAGAAERGAPAPLPGALPGAPPGAPRVSARALNSPPAPAPAPAAAGGARSAPSGRPVRAAAASGKAKAGARAPAPSSWAEEEEWGEEGDVDDGVSKAPSMEFDDLDAHLEDKYGF